LVESLTGLPIAYFLLHENLVFQSTQSLFFSFTPLPIHYLTYNIFVSFGTHMHNINLTHRQQEFLNALIDLTRRAGRAVHYSTVAEHLGVGKVSAYEMLRVLEDKDLVRREFLRSETSSGPGRSAVVFVPTSLALPTLSGTAEEWARIKAEIIGKLQRYRPEGYDRMLNDLLERLPRRRSASWYLAEMSTAIALGVHSLRDHPEVHRLQRLLKEIGLPGELGVNAIPGLGAGLALVGRFNRRLSDLLLAQASKTQAHLSELSVETRKQLAEFTREIMDIISG
jgi:energy-coupling factor transport system substrate-specific component